MFSLKQNSFKIDLQLDSKYSKYSKYSLCTGGPIAPEGEILYGKMYEKEGKGFQSGWAFVGEMAGINVWDRALSDQEILEMSKSCTAGKGNVISMDNLKVMGGVQKIPVSC